MPVWMHDLMKCFEVKEEQREVTCFTSSLMVEGHVIQITILGSRVKPPGTGRILNLVLVPYLTCQSLTEVVFKH